MLLQKGVLKICNKFTGEHPCPSAISSSFIEITLWQGCSPVNLLPIFRISFPKNSSKGLLLNHERILSYFWDLTFGSLRFFFFFFSLLLTAIYIQCILNQQLLFFILPLNVKSDVSAKNSKKRHRKRSNSSTVLSGHMNLSRPLSLGLNALVPRLALKLLLACSYRFY